MKGDINFRKAPLSATLIHLSNQGHIVDLIYVPSDQLYPLNGQYGFHVWFYIFIFFSNGVKVSQEQYFESRLVDADLVLRFAYWLYKSVENRIPENSWMPARASQTTL